MVGAATDEDRKPLLEILGSKNQSASKRPHSKNTIEPLLLNKDDVDARIQSLQSELKALEESKKVRSQEHEDVHAIGAEAYEEEVIGSASSRDVEGCKENMGPRQVKDPVLVEAAVGKSWKIMEANLQGKSMLIGEVKKEAVDVQDLKELDDDKSTAALNHTQVDCGDVVRLFALIEGTKKEIGKGIVMGLAGSKHARKIIPKGWRSIKVTLYTSNAISEPCPFPIGWAEHVKQQTLKEASGRTILWPDRMLRSRLYK